MKTYLLALFAALLFAASASAQDVVRGPGSVTVGDVTVTAPANNPLYVRCSDGTNAIDCAASHVDTDDGTVAGGTSTGTQIAFPYFWNSSNWVRFTGDATNGLDVDVTRSVLPTGAATLAKQPALGTAGTASADVITVQGIANGTALGVQSNGANLATQTSMAAVATSLSNATSGAGWNITQLAGAAVPMTTTQADAMANTADGLNTTTFNYIFNGSTWDRWTGAVTCMLCATAANQATIISSLATIAAAQTGDSTFYKNAAGTTEDEHEIKATAGRLFTIIATNTADTKSYLRCYNLTAANTTPGSSTVWFAAAIPANAAGGGFAADFGPNGRAFSVALTCTITTDEADSSATTEVAANSVKVNYGYK